MLTGKPLSLWYNETNIQDARMMTFLVVTNDGVERMLVKLLAIGRRSLGDLEC